MKNMEEAMFSNAALAHFMTFKRLDPYQVENLCETLYNEFEQFMDGLIDIKAFKLSDFKHLHIIGMRKFHLKQIHAQKLSYESFCKSQRLLACMPIELTEEEKNDHKEKYKHIFDELDAAQTAAAKRRHRQRQKRAAQKRKN